MAAQAGVSPRGTAWVGRTGLVLLAAAVLLGRLSEGDEDLRYAVVAKSILHTGDWVHLHDIDVPYYNKPPLAIWATAAIFRVFGISASSARAFSALCTVGAAVLLFAAVRAFRDENEALLAAAILCLMPGLAGKCGDGRLDGPQLCWLMLAAWGYARGVAGERRWPLVWVGVACGLGTMTKSPFILLVLPVFAAHAALTGRFRRLVHPWLWVGLVAGVAIVVPWYVAMARSDPAFLQHHFGKEMADRVLGQGYFTETRTSRVHHLWLLVRRTLLWSALALVGAWKGVGALRRREGDYPLLLLLWLGVLGVATYSVSRMTYKYNVPLFPAIAGLAAFALYGWLPERRRERLPRYVFALAVGALAVTALLPYTFRGSRYATVKLMAPVVQEQVAPTEPVIGYKVRHTWALGTPRLVVFYFLDRRLEQVADPAEIARRRPALLLSDAKVFDGEIAPLGYHALLRRDDLVLGFRVQPAQPRPAADPLR